MKNEDENKVELTEINLTVDETRKKEIKSIKKDQDEGQRSKVYFLFLIEIFKVAMASFLSISVVQKCDQSICSFSENIKRNSNYGRIVIGVNIVNILAFSILYFIEFKREMFMIRYLDVNKYFGDYHLPTVINNYEDIKLNLIKYNNKYYLSTKVLLSITGLNWILSGVLVFGSYYSVKTVTSFATNILLVITKLTDAYSISKESSKKNYGLSAYIKEYTSFNTIDKDHE